MSIVHRTSLLKYIKNPTQFGKKTSSYIIANSDNNQEIGIIQWSTDFRQYSFFPNSNTVFEKTYLKDITEFLVKLGEEHADLRKLIDKGIGKINKCDLCGQYFTGEKHDVYDENYNNQPGLISCTKCKMPEEN